MEGSGESYSIYTLRHWNTMQEAEIVFINISRYEWKAYFDGAHDSPNALQFFS